ncbi:MAG: hypothetical protein KJ771_08845 [Nanoarchaeota archaeon]|nr:hypothetical protein [Nanoarchaeota archaeon]
MVFTYGNVLYNELKIRGFIRDFSVKGPPIKNVRLLDDILSEMNITKCTIRDVERNYSGTILHLEYLLQSQHDINFCVCDFFKIWKNKQGWQYGCWFDKGKNRRIQVYCYGSLSKCERAEEYESKIGELQNGKK